MESIDGIEYYVSDIDIGMNDINKSSIDINKYEETRKNNISFDFSYNYELYNNICYKYDIKPDNYIYTLISLTLFKLSNWRRTIMITDEIEKKLINIVKKIICEKLFFIYIWQLLQPYYLIN